MKVQELIDKLKNLQDHLGNAEVLITDGWNCRRYRGDYDVVEYIDLCGVIYIDIRVGGCQE